MALILRNGGSQSPDRWLREPRNNHLTSGRLYEHLAEVDTRAEVMFHELVKTLAEKENVTEKLKAENTLLWIRKMNNIRNRATEIVNVEVIYV